jgi:hypothetical protein
MREGKHKPDGILYITGLLALLVIFSACDTPFDGYWEYEFSNETSYSITIFLDKAYKTSKEGSEIDTSLYLYSNGNEIVYVKSDSLGFRWETGYYSSENRNIYPEKNGSKVTFKERKK